MKKNYLKGGKPAKKSSRRRQRYINDILNCHEKLHHLNWDEKKDEYYCGHPNSLFLQCRYKLLIPEMGSPYKCYCTNPKGRTSSIVDKTRKVTKSINETVQTLQKVLKKQNGKT